LALEPLLTAAPAEIAERLSKAPALGGTLIRIPAFCDREG
jgi:hypothetical protein